MKDRFADNIKEYRKILHEIEMLVRISKNKYVIPILAINNNEIITIDPEIYTNKIKDLNNELDKILVDIVITNQNDIKDSLFTNPEQDKDAEDKYLQVIRSISEEANPTTLESKTKAIEYLFAYEKKTDLSDDYKKKYITKLKENEELKNIILVSDNDTPVIGYIIPQGYPLEKLLTDYAKKIFEIGFDDPNDPSKTVQFKDDTYCKIRLKPAT